MRNLIPNVNLLPVATIRTMRDIELEHSLPTSVDVTHGLLRSIDPTALQVTADPDSPLT